MRLVPFVTVAALSLCAAFSTGCRRHRADSPTDRFSMLRSPDADDRRDAAHDLMDDGGPSPDAVPHLIAALQQEQDPKTYGMILLALGKSGAPEAKPYIDANLNNPSKGVRERADQALQAWSRRNPNGVMNGPPPPMPPVPPESPGDEPPPPPQGNVPLPPPPPPPPPPGSGQTI